MLSKAQKKNAWRTRRRESLRNSAEDRSCIVKHDSDLNAETCRFKQSVDKKKLIAWALSVIQYYCILWQYAKASPLVTRHKQKLFKNLFLFGNHKGIFDNWTKSSGHICYNIEGYHKHFLSANGTWKQTSIVKYDFCDCDETLGRYVLTISGSLYALRDHRTKGTPEEFSVAQEKKTDLIKFRVVHGLCPRRPS